MQVAICQTLCKDSDLEGNLQRIEAAVAEAAEQSADLICFPDSADLGWVNPNAHQLAEPIPGAVTDALGEMARRHQVLIACGVTERDGDQLHDSAVLIDVDGTILIKHRKVNILSELMDPPYTPGSVSQPNVAETSLGRIGLLICADTFKDDVVRAVTDQEPDLLVVPYGWAAPAESWPEHGKSLTSIVRSTVERVGCPVIGVDCVGTISNGPWTGHVYGGQSVAIDRNGRMLTTLPDRDSAIRVINVEPGREVGH